MTLGFLGNERRPPSLPKNADPQVVLTAANSDTSKIARCRIPHLIYAMALVLMISFVWVPSENGKIEWIHVPLCPTTYFENTTSTNLIELQTSFPQYDWVLSSVCRVDDASRTHASVPAWFHTLPAYCCGSHVWIQYCGTALVLIGFKVTKRLGSVILSCAIVFIITFAFERTYWHHICMILPGCLYGLLLEPTGNEQTFAPASLAYFVTHVTANIGIFLTFRGMHSIRISQSDRTLDEILLRFPFAILLQRGGMYFVGIMILILVSTQAIERIKGTTAFLILFVLNAFARTESLFLYV